MDEALGVAVKDDVCACFALLGWGGALSSALRAAVLVFCLNFSTGITKVKAVFSQRETASSKMSKTTAAGIPYENKHIPKIACFFQNFHTVSIHSLGVLV